MKTPMSQHVLSSLHAAAQSLGVRDPAPYLEDIIKRSFAQPDDDVRYA